MHNKNNTKQFSFHFIFLMFLYIIIVILSVIIVSMGKNIYDNINEDRNINYELKVSLSYIANKIRQSDKNNAVEIKKNNNTDSIVIIETYDEEIYETWIYFYDGGIYEMFTDKDTPFELSDGMKIVEADNLLIEKIYDNLYKFTATSKNLSSELYICLYSN